MSLGSTALSARVQLDADQSQSVRKLATCPTRMHAGVCSACADDGYRGLADLVDGPFDRFLDREVIGLALPPWRSRSRRIPGLT